MAKDELNRSYLTRELEVIRDKIVQLADESTDASNLQNDLAILGLRIDQLVVELAGPESSRKDISPAKVILVVDDNEELRTFIKQALELVDYIVLEAGDEDETLAVLGKTTVLDLVLCDVILPGTKGPELVEKIQEMFPDIKVIFMSGYIAEDIISDDVELIDTSGDNFLKKPFPTRALLETVQHSLEN